MCKILFLSLFASVCALGQSLDDAEIRSRCNTLLANLASTGVFSQSREEIQAKALPFKAEYEKYKKIYDLQKESVLDRLKKMKNQHPDERQREMDLLSSCKYGQGTLLCVLNDSYVRANPDEREELVKSVRSMLQSKRNDLYPELYDRKTQYHIVGGGSYINPRYQEQMQPFLHLKQYIAEILHGEERLNSLTSADLAIRNCTVNVEKMSVESKNLLAHFGLGLEQLNAHDSFNEVSLNSESTEQKARRTLRLIIHALDTLPTPSERREALSKLTILGGPITRNSSDGSLQIDIERAGELNLPFKDALGTLIEIDTAQHQLGSKINEIERELASEAVDAWLKANP